MSRIIKTVLEVTVLHTSKSKDPRTMSMRQLFTADAEGTMLIGARRLLRRELAPTELAQEAEEIDGAHGTRWAERWAAACCPGCESPTCDDPLCDKGPN